jgi:hypothetical protein
MYDFIVGLLDCWIVKLLYCCTIQQSNNPTIQQFNNPTIQLSNNSISIYNRIRQLIFIVGGVGEMLF